MTEGTLRLNDSRIVVTGGSGFLGTYVRDRPRAAGCEPFASREHDWISEDADRWHEAERRAPRR